MQKVVIGAWEARRTFGKILVTVGFRGNTVVVEKNGERLAANVPYASHGGGAQLHVLAALPNTLLMESGLLPAGAPRLVDGCYLLPEEPGLGGQSKGLVQ
jgi:hypothetical protein